MTVFTNRASSSAAEADAYVAGLLELLGDRAPEDVLTATGPALRARAATLDPAELRRREAPGKWSVTHVLQHLADSELVWGWRLRMVLAHDRPTITGYDQDAWADHLGYDNADPAAALDEFDVLRLANLRLIRNAGPDALRRVGVHNERGEESVGHMMKLYAGHDLLHLAQIDRIAAAMR